MEPTEPVRADLALGEVFMLLGQCWTGQIVGVLLQRPARFAEIRRAVPGISERMLSDRLAKLGQAELVVREVDPGPPVSVTYRLTESGEALRPALAELRKWAISRGYEPASGDCAGHGRHAAAKPDRADRQRQ